MTKSFIVPNIQLFAEGNANPAQNGGNDNAGQNSGNDGATFTQAQLDEIADARAERARNSALRSFFQQKGMEESEIAQAIEAYKQKRAESQPNIDSLQNQLMQAQQEAKKARIESMAMSEALSQGVDIQTAPYVIKLADIAKAAKEDGSIDAEAIKAAISKVLEDVPQFSSAARGTGGQVSPKHQGASHFSAGFGANLAKQKSQNIKSTYFDKGV